MPRVLKPESLVKLCVKCVTNAVHSGDSVIGLSAIMLNYKMTAINSESFTNPFHQLRKFIN